MTVSTTTNRAGFVCNGVTYQFPFDFKILAESDLQVYLYNTITRLTSQLTLNVDYTVEIASPGPGGTVTLIGAYGPPCPPGVIPGAEYTLTILRAMPRTQEIDFVNGDDLDEQNIEGMGDRITMMVQELDNKMARTLAFPPTSGISNISVPDPVAGAFLRWNLSGNGLENATYVDPTLITISDYWRAVIDGGDTLPEALTAMGLDPSLSTLTLPDNVTISDFIKTLLDDADAAAARATLGALAASDLTAASESAAGIAELATHAEVDAGADDARIVTPKKLLATPMIYRKNLLINGDFRVWQRGSSFAAIASGAYHADRWRVLKVGEQVLTISQSTDFPASAEAYSPYSLKALITTADTSIAATQFLVLEQGIEGYTANRLYGARKATLSFWVKSSVTGTYGAVLRNGACDRSYLMTYTINSANTWEKKTLSYDFTGATSAGTWNTTNGCGIWVEFTLLAGSNYQTATTGVWVNGGMGLSTSSQVNFAGTVNNAFYLSRVQFEVGDAATEFDERDYGTELTLCQRYYEKSYDLGTAAGSTTLIGAPIQHGGGSILLTGASFKVRKRAIPTVVIYSPYDGASDRVAYYNVNDAYGSYWSPCYGSSISEAGFNISGPASGFSSSYMFRFHWTASAEL